MTNKGRCVELNLQCLLLAPEKLRNNALEIYLASNDRIPPAAILFFRYFGKLSKSDLTYIRWLSSGMPIS